jgi:hypothetical protein
MTNVIEELHLGANILLAYFHYCCKGFQPFAPDWDPSETTSMAHLDPEQINFVQQTARYVQSNSEAISEFRRKPLANVRDRIQIRRNQREGNLRGPALLHRSIV